MRRNARQGGFTLIELMLVTQILTILTIIALPNMLRARMSANEAAAAGSMRLIGMSQASFKASRFADAAGDGEGDYATLEQLFDPEGNGASPPFIDIHLAEGNRNGYLFNVDVFLGGPGIAPGYEAFASPRIPLRTGIRNFYVDEESVIRFTTDGSLPGPNSPSF